MPFDLKQLRLALAAQRFDSIVNAARVPEISKDFLAAQIAELEARLRVPIFASTYPDVIATSRASQILEAADRLPRPAGPATCPSIRSRTGVVRGSGRAL
jgi:DNA-binding transcriptional LysR family regulator